MTYFVGAGCPAKLALEMYFAKGTGATRRATGKMRTMENESEVYLSAGRPRLDAVTDCVCRKNGLGTK